MSKLICQLLGVSPDGYLGNLKASIKNKTSLFGVEVEVENVSISTRMSVQNTVAGWNVVEDHSLRHSGLEFIFNEPKDYTTTIEMICRTLPILQQGNVQTSHRTSIHVHNSLLGKTEQDLLQYNMLYFFAERALYRFVGRFRNYNNFCVPWHARSKIPVTFHEFRTAPKYMGLSGFRLGDLGTAEWRHMPGTFDVDKVCKWIEMIHRLDMYTFSDEMKHPLEAMPEEILEVLQKIFIHCTFSIDEVIMDILHLKGLR